ncbi:hypothetical protein DdX_10827 [Ditylenchus destructor]|uniref:Uncharacterized protein n=1 Tax=Ditylenchus destructor TaxID=166010 RepID=A0AAD4MZ66_9BILA|nr:hypothetical protein DdX_10827 [Ditylenchus destructor]
MLYFYTALFSILLFDLDVVISTLTDPSRRHDKNSNKNYYDVTIVVFIKPNNYIVKVLEQHSPHSPANNSVQYAVSDTPKNDILAEIVAGTPFEFRLSIDRDTVPLDEYIYIYFHAYTRTQPSTNSPIVAEARRREAEKGRKFNEAYFKLAYQVWSETPLPRIFTIDMRSKEKKLEYIEPKPESKIEVKEETPNNAHLLTLTFANANDSQILMTEFGGKDVKTEEKGFLQRKLFTPPRIRPSDTPIDSSQRAKQNELSPSRIRVGRGKIWAARDPEKSGFPDFAQLRTFYATLGSGRVIHQSTALNEPSKMSYHPAGSEPG